MLLKVFQTAEIVKAATRKVLAQANRYIDVARIGLASGRGTEQRNALHASGTELLFMPLQGAYDLIALHGLILPTRFRPVKPCEFQHLRRPPSGRKGALLPGRFVQEWDSLALRTVRKQILTASK